MFLFNTLKLCMPVILAVMCITGCSMANTVSFAKITAAQAQEEMQNGNPIVLDVRTEQEYGEGHIENAVLLTDTDIETKASEILTDKEQRILVYCRSGRRSAAAAQKLADMGYTNVADFGGIIDWTGMVVK